MSTKKKIVSTNNNVFKQTRGIYTRIWENYAFQLKIDI